jgi:hypothetical protein
VMRGKRDRLQAYQSRFWVTQITLEAIISCPLEIVASAQH